MPIGPELPPHLLSRQRSPESDEPMGLHIPRQLPAQDEENEDYGPALPPDILATRSNSQAHNSNAGPSRVAARPSMPDRYGARASYNEDDDDDDDDVGPKPLPASFRHEEVDGVKLFMEKEEKRRKEVEEAAKPKTLKRDEWMLVPPSSSDLLGKLDPTKLKARQFARTAAPAKTVDNSLWTETPAERLQRITDEVSGKKRRAANAEETVGPEEALEARKKRKIDEQIRKGVEEHTRNTRGSTLIDMHSQTIKKDEEDPKSKAIWDHSRDMSLGGRLMDDSTRNKMLRDARGLGDRFGTGKSGGFL